MKPIDLFSSYDKVYNKWGQEEESDSLWFLQRTNLAFKSTVCPCTTYRSLCMRVKKDVVHDAEELEWLGKNRGSLCFSLTLQVY